MVHEFDTVYRCRTCREVLNDEESRDKHLSIPLTGMVAKPGELYRLKNKITEELQAVRKPDQIFIPTALILNGPWASRAHIRKYAVEDISFFHADRNTDIGKVAYGPDTFHRVFLRNLMDKPEEDISPYLETLTTREFQTVTDTMRSQLYEDNESVLEHFLRVLKAFNDRNVPITRGII